ncbi:MAG: ABC transporter ATP-binding protein [Verrucomicrobiota bacterium]
MKVVLDRLNKETVELHPVEVGAGLLGQLNAWKQALEVQLGSWLPLPGEEVQLAGVLVLVGLLAGTAGLRGVCNYLSSYCMRWSSEHTIRDLKRTVLAKVQSLSLDYFNQSAMGDMLTRIDIDTVALNKAWGLALTDLIRQPLTFIVTLGTIIFLVDFRLTVMALVFFPVCVLPVVILGNKVRRHAKRSRETGVQQSSRLIDFFFHIRTVKAYGLEQMQQEEYDATSQRIAQANLKRDNAFTMVNPIIETVAALGFCVVLLAAFVLGSPLTDLATFLIGFFLAYTPLKRLGTVNNNFQEASVSADRLQKVLALEPTVHDHHTGKQAVPLHQALEFSEVCFAYNKDEPVLKGISFTLGQGEFIGLAGPSGSGKSTLINLILRYYDPTAGEIRWDGTDLKVFSIDSLRRNIALVGQDVAVFDRTVRENIAFGLPDASDAAVRHAAEFACADEFIREMPNGYDTILGEQGTRLSGGQKQRISIARAFLRDARLLILDEATAALDSSSESRIQEVINRLSADRSVIAIAHRLATLSHADRILVLDQGEIVESGGYSELLARGGVFARQAALQGIFQRKAV